MAYLGRGLDKISNIEVLDNITFDGSSSYSITKSSVAFTPNSAQSLLISIDGVVQAGNFTVSGSTIDFGTAVAGTSTCDFILHYGVGLITTPADGTVTTAKLGDSAVTTAKLNDASVSLAKLTATGTKDATTFLRGDNTFAGAGITQTDQWRLTADFSTTGNNFLTTNLERVDINSFGYIGTGMTESSGVFTFPSTGVYKVEAIASCALVTQDTMGVQIHFTTDNSTYVPVANSFYGGAAAGGELGMGYGSIMLDITDTANFKVKFQAQSIGTSNVLAGNTNQNYTHFNFIRLGDT